MDTKLYFGYGSNLDGEDWEQWCSDHGYPSGLLEPLYSAYLPDRRLCFGHRSENRKGGVLDIREAVDIWCKGWCSE